MEFEQFVANPTAEMFGKCKKVDLILVASSFDVHVPLSVKKELQSLLHEKLSERGLIGEPAPTVGVELDDLPGIPAPLPTSQSQPGMTAEELRLTLRIKEVEVRQWELEVESMHLKVRALELEPGAAVASGPLPKQTSTPSLHDSFDVSRHISLVPSFRESEVDSYFIAFERIAPTLHWPVCGLFYRSVSWLGKHRRCATL